MERMKPIENLNVRGACAQGIVRAASTIRICIASCQRAVWHQIGRVGYLHVDATSFFRSGC